MPRKQGAAAEGNGDAENVRASDASDEASASTASSSGASNGRDDLLADAATVGVICVAAALFEVALIPGMIIGVAATLAPKVLPKLGTAVEPAFRSAVRGAYKIGQKARHVVAEAEEQVRDIVAEANAEGAAPAPKA